MNRACAIEAIVQRRHQQLVCELVAYDAMQVRYYTAFYLGALQEALALRGPFRPPWDGSIRVPPGMPERDDGLRALRLRCYAKLMARRHVASMRRWERER